MSSDKDKKWRGRWTMDNIKQVVAGENPFPKQFGGFKKAGKAFNQRAIGEEWTDAKGKTWKKTSQSTKSSVNKQGDLIRELTRPKCSKCGRWMELSDDRLDKKVFPKTGKCFDCLVLEETQMRIDGTWDAYEEMKILKNKRSMLVEFKNKVEEAIHYLENDTGVMGDVVSSGEVIEYHGKSNPQWLIDAREDHVKVIEEIKKVEEELKKVDDKFESKLTV
jgi:hypothetical protein